MSNATDLALRRLGAVKLPDNLQWENRFQVRSETSSRLYTVARNKSNGTWGCSCMGWIRYRHCKHLTAMNSILQTIPRVR